MIQEITVDEVKQSITNNDGARLLDVRTKEEYTRNRIAGAVNLPVDDVESGVLSIFPDKNTKIFVYCLSGSRSEIAVELMSKLGYRNVFNMKGGLLVWRIKQFPLET